MRDDAFPADCLPAVSEFLRLGSVEAIEQQYDFRRRRPKMTVRQRVLKESPETSVLEALNLQAEQIERVFGSVSGLIDPRTLYRLLDHDSLFVFFSIDLMPLESSDSRLQEAVSAAILRKAHLVYFFPTDEYACRFRDQFGIDIDLRERVRLERMDEFRRAVCDYANERADRERKPRVTLEDVQNQITVFFVNESPFCMPRTTIGLFRQGSEARDRRVTVRLPLIADSAEIIPLPNSSLGTDFATMIERFVWREWGRILLDEQPHVLSRKQALNLCARFSLGTFRDWGRLDPSPTGSERIKRLATEIQSHQ